MLNRVSEFAFCFLRDNQNTSGNRGYRLFFFISDTAKSQARAVSAMYVSDGFTQEEETMHAPSVRNRFLASCAGLCALSTEVLGWRPMRAVHISWLARA